jgi:hypothetical protein
MNELELERLLLDCEALPLGWNYSYGITDDRRRAFLSSSRHPDSFLNPTSETAMTMFMLARLDNGEQAHLIDADFNGSSPRDRAGNWSNAFFNRFGTPRWNSPTDPPRRGPLGEFFANQFGFDDHSAADPFLLLEVKTFNNAFNGGQTVRNLSFLVVKGEWSRFDALVILPAARTLVFIESKVGSDGKHGAGGHDVKQQVRNVETIFFLTNLPDSQYRDWKFRYVLLCPGAAVPQARKDCESFFQNQGHVRDLDGHDAVLKTLHESKNPDLNVGRYELRDKWADFRRDLDSKLLVLTWNQMMQALCDAGFDPVRYLDRLSRLEADLPGIVNATSERWRTSGIRLPSEPAAS